MRQSWTRTAFALLDRSQKHCLRPFHRGFTLVELLVVIAIISVLIAILLPSLQAARKQARAVSCLSQMRQLGMGFQMYADSWKGIVPFGLCRVQVNDGGNAAALYWDDFLRGAELAGTGAANREIALIPNDQVFYCPNNKEMDPATPGIYGAPDNDTNNNGMGDRKWGSDPSKQSDMPFIQPAKVPFPSDFPLLSDSTMAITKFPGRGARIWIPNNWAVAANASSRGMIWLAHRNQANVLFADGHAESCDTDRLLHTSIVHDLTAKVFHYGITHWCTEDMKQETKPLP